MAASSSRFSSSRLASAAFAVSAPSRRARRPAFGSRHLFVARCLRPRSRAGRQARKTLCSLLALAMLGSGFASVSCAAPRLLPDPSPLRTATAGYELTVLVDGQPLPAYEYGGETYVLGELGARYTLRIQNHTARRIEAVASVDGRDAMDGKPADFGKRGYLVPAFGSVDIDGWRLSHREVAAFRFSGVADSYAARTGSAREVGVIGVAIFPERVVQPRPIYTPRVPNYSFDQPSDGEALRDRTPAKRAMGDDLLGGVAPSAQGRGSAGGSSIGMESGRAPAPRAEEAPAASPRRTAGGNDQQTSGLAKSAPAPTMRPGLGTEFGEAVGSPVREIAFTRANSTRPAALLGARYNDRAGLMALGIDVDGCCDSQREIDLALRRTADPFPGSQRGFAAPPSGWHRGCCLRY